MLSSPSSTAHSQLPPAYASHLSPEAMASGISCETGPGAPRSVEPSEDLRPCEKKALHEFRARLEDAIVSNQQLVKPSGREKSRSRVACSADACGTEPKEDPREVSLWGIPLLPSQGHEGTDVILLKFLQAREFKVSDAFAMLQKTLRWRREFGADSILEEELELPELDDAACVNGTDKEGHPVCYNICGAFKDKDLYRRTFGSKEERERFVRWRVRFMEKGIQQLSFKPGGAGSLLQVIDLKDSCSPEMKELRSATKRVVSILQDNYPEFVVKNVRTAIDCMAYIFLKSSELPKCSTFPKI